jgi:hypothetical protein
MFFVKNFIIFIIYSSLIAVIEAQSCICMQYLGNHCGDRVSDGLLRGYCEKKYLYHCSAAYFPAQRSGLCKSCQHSSKPGMDFCENGEEGNDALNLKKTMFLIIFMKILDL